MPHPFELPRMPKGTLSCILASQYPSGDEHELVPRREREPLLLQEILAQPSVGVPVLLVFGGYVLQSRPSPAPPSEFKGMGIVPSAAPRS